MIVNSKPIVVDFPQKQRETHLTLFKTGALTQVRDRGADILQRGVGRGRPDDDAPAVTLSMFRGETKSFFCNAGIVIDYA